MIALICRKVAQGVVISLKVIPKASRSEIVGIEGNELKVRIAAPPEKGKANEEVIQFFSLLLKIPRTQITVCSGEKSRHKKLLIKDAALTDIQAVVRKISHIRNYSDTCFVTETELIFNAGLGHEKGDI